MGRRAQNFVPFAFYHHNFIINRHFNSPAVAGERNRVRATLSKAIPLRPDQLGRNRNDPVHNNPLKD